MLPLDHVFLTFPGSNDVRIENIAFRSLIEELRDSFLPIWPHGVASEQAQDHTWRATFNGTPWSSSGVDFILYVFSVSREPITDCELAPLRSRRMICTLFAILANEVWPKSLVSIFYTLTFSPGLSILSHRQPNEPSKHSTPVQTQ